MARVTWDENKRRRVLAERNVDLQQAALVLDGRPYIVEDTRHDYGERRFIAVGEFQGEAFTVVYTPRTDPATGEDIVHIVTAWRSGRKPRHGRSKRDD